MTVNEELETKLILENMGLVISIAKQFQPKSKSELDEYVQAGSIGLLRAIRKYDAQQAMLSTWAYKNIRWEIIRQIGKNTKYKHLSLNDVDIPSSYISGDLLEYIPDYLEHNELEVLMLKRAGYNLKEMSEILSLSTYEIGKLMSAAVDKIRKANE